MNKDFDEYVAKYSADLTRLCVTLCGREADAEDLFQETWHKAMKNYAKYDSNRPFDKWLNAICVNTYKNSRKLGWNRNRIRFQTDEEQNQFFDSIPYPSNERDKFLELYEALNSLPGKLKIVVVLRYFKDYTVSDIADILKIPEGTVKSRLYSARTQLKRRLEHE